MQKRIERLILANLAIDNCECDNVLEVSVAGVGAEIAKLFERKVIWEGEAYVDAFGRIRFLDPQSGELPIPTVDDEELRGEMFYPALAAGRGTVSPWAGQRVRVVVEKAKGIDVQ